MFLAETSVNKSQTSTNKSHILLLLFELITLLSVYYNQLELTLETEMQ